MHIADKEIGRHASPFVIAEMSGNHNQSLERALEIVEVTARTGAHALKIQTYIPDKMTIDLDEREFNISKPGSLRTRALSCKPLCYCPVPIQRVTI